MGCRCSSGTLRKMQAAEPSSRGASPKTGKKMCALTAMEAVTLVTSSNLSA